MFGRPPRVVTRTGLTFSDWADRTYGPGWTATKTRYWSSRFTRKRCVWCWRKAKPGRFLDLNHLTYRFVRGDGWTPLWSVVPMCRTCHRVETWLTRRFRPGMRRRRQRWAHAWVTFGVVGGQLLALAVLVGWGWFSLTGAGTR
jgi:hypothetical protein